MKKQQKIPRLHFNDVKWQDGVIRKMTMILTCCNVLVYACMIIRMLWGNVGKRRDEMTHYAKEKEERAVRCSILNSAMSTIVTKVTQL